MLQRCIHHLVVLVSSCTLGTHIALRVQLPGLLEVASVCIPRDVGLTYLTVRRYPLTGLQWSKLQLRGSHAFHLSAGQQLYLDEEWDLCDSAHPFNKVPRQCVVHVAVENVDSACCTNLVVGLYSERQLP